MTREEIEKLPIIVAMILSKSMTVNENEKIHEKITEVCNLAIKALEQEPSATPQESILDKIRAEITNRQPYTLCILSMGEEYERGIDDMMNQALMIIDKYQAESEGKGCGK